VPRRKRRGFEGTTPGLFCLSPLSVDSKPGQPAAGIRQRLLTPLMFAAREGDLDRRTF